MLNQTLQTAGRSCSLTLSFHCKTHSSSATGLKSTACCRQQRRGARSRCHVQMAELTVGASVSVNGCLSQCGRAMDWPLVQGVTPHCLRPTTAGRGSRSNPDFRKKPVLKMDGWLSLLSSHSKLHQGIGSVSAIPERSTLMMNVQPAVCTRRQNTDRSNVDVMNVTTLFFEGQFRSHCKRVFPPLLSRPAKCTLDWSSSTYYTEVSAAWITLNKSHWPPRKDRRSVDGFIRRLSESAPVPLLSADPSDQVIPHHWLQLDASLQDWRHNTSVLRTV